MPWKDTNPMDERIKLISDSIDGHFTVTELSVIYEVSRKTVYKWIKRYSEHGIEGLKELSRAPLSSPTRTPDAIIEHLVRTKLDRMSWGPKKILAYLNTREPDVEWPRVGTIEKWLKNRGLVKKRRRRRVVPPYREPFLDANEINKVWSADYKGQFRTGDGLWCYPLTISDNASRYILSCKALGSPCYEDTRKWFEWTFREYGLPDAIRTDNGTPFAGHGLTGLSRLSVWMIKLGIRPERISVGEPQENGRHERMHRTLKEETVSPPASNIAAQQKRFDDFVYDYNNIRPHEGISQKAPSSMLHHRNVTRKRYEILSMKSV
jgi:transposase InsO family protein